MTQFDVPPAFHHECRSLIATLIAAVVDSEKLSSVQL